MDPESGLWSIEDRAHPALTYDSQTPKGPSGEDQLDAPWARMVNFDP
jgi:hypothetical protein